MKDLLQQIAKGQTLSEDQSRDAFEQIMTGQAQPSQVGALLMAWQVRQPTIDEVVGAARVMRDKVTPVRVPDGLTPIDTCGVGGDHAGTFNISTAAAIVAAAAARPNGVVVAKHGNRAVTSKSGSSQVLEALGVKLTVAPDTLTACMDQAGICFCFAPAHHPAMKHAAPIRAELGFRTIFNILGPLTNPAGARRQVIGAPDVALGSLIAGALRQLGVDHAMVVLGTFDDQRGVDEISTLGKTWISEIIGDAMPVVSEFDPQTIGLAQPKPAQLQADGVDASAAMIRDVLAGKPGPARDIVCLNAAAALVVADLADNLAQGFTQAAQTIDDGAAQMALARLAELTQADPA